MKKGNNKLMRGSSIGRREFLAQAGKLGLVITGTSMLPRLARGAKELAPKETKKFKVRWQVPGGKTFPPGTKLGYMSWEPWCRPYQMKVFAEHTGIKKIETSFYSSTNEMMTKLGAGGVRSYDMMSPSQDSIKRCVEAGWFQPINRANIPHYKDLHPEFQENPFVFIDGRDYMIPFVWGSDAVIHNTDKIPVIDSWSFLYDPKFKGRISYVDNAVFGMGPMAIYLGYKNPFQLGEEDLQRIKAEFAKIKPQLKVFHTTMAQAETLMASGEIWAIAGAWVVMLPPLRAQGLPVKWSWPKEGCVGWFEGLSISAYTKNKEAAEIFADWCVGEEFGAMLVKDIGYYPCSTASKVNLTQEEISSVYLDKPEIPAKTCMADVPQNVDRWQEIWSEIKAL